MEGSCIVFMFWLANCFDSFHYKDTFYQHLHVMCKHIHYFIDTIDFKCKFLIDSKFFGVTQCEWLWTKHKMLYDIQFGMNRRSKKNIQQVNDKDVFTSLTLTQIARQKLYRCSLDGWLENNSLDLLLFLINSKHVHYQQMHHWNTLSRLVYAHSIISTYSSFLPYFFE